MRSIAYHHCESEYNLRLMICTFGDDMPTSSDDMPLLSQWIKKNHSRVRLWFFLAEKERFELSRRYYRPTPLAGAPLRPLEYFSMVESAVSQDSQVILYPILCLLSICFFIFFYVSQKNLPTFCTVSLK